MKVRGKGKEEEKKKRLKKKRWREMGGEKEFSISCLFSRTVTDW